MEGIDIGRQDGINYVIDNPDHFNLYTEIQVAEYEREGEERGRLHGRLEILSNPSAFNLYTDQSIQDLKMGGLILEKETENNIDLS